LKSFRPLLAAIGLYLFAHGSDIVSTIVGSEFFDLVEQNPLMRDPLTLKFILWKGLCVKGIFTALLPMPMAIAAWLGTRNAYVASLPFWYYGIQALWPTVHNTILIWKVVNP
jgi:hypothetical protein